jgi:hypothetical protein
LSLNSLRDYGDFAKMVSERLSQGTEAGTPGKAVRPTGRTWSYGWEGQLAVRAGRLGRPQSPTKGSTARKPRQLPEVARLVSCSGLPPPLLPDPPLCRPCGRLCLRIPPRLRLSSAGSLRVLPLAGWSGSAVTLRLLLSPFRCRQTLDLTAFFTSCTLLWTSL